MLQKMANFRPEKDGRPWTSVHTDQILNQSEDLRLVSETMHFGQHVRVYYMTLAKYEELLLCQD